jgi:hypothetical protein
MDNFWFGPAPFSAACDDLNRTQTPILPCHWCGEPFSDTDCGYTVPVLGTITAVAYHWECQVRQVIGSVGHQMRTCSCYGGFVEDPPHLTKRQAALEAVRLFELGRILAVRPQ